MHDKLSKIRLHETHVLDYELNILWRIKNLLVNSVSTLQAVFFEIIIEGVVLTQHGRAQRSCGTWWRR